MTDRGDSRNEKDAQPDYFDPRSARLTAQTNRGLPAPASKRSPTPKRRQRSPQVTRYQFEDQLVLAERPARPLQSPPLRLIDVPQWRVKPLPSKEKWPGPYPSIELQGADPRTDDPAEAVAVWLDLHKNEIAAAAKRWRVDKRAIAGAIAWEALQNPNKYASIRGPGPGKPHAFSYIGNVPQWTEVVELTQRMPRQTFLDRRRITKDPNTAIQYIAAALDVIAHMAEYRGWSLRDQPGVLTFAYHARDIESWSRTLTVKPKGSEFELPRCHLPA